MQELFSSLEIADLRPGKTFSIRLGSSHLTNSATNSQLVVNRTHIVLKYCFFGTAAVNYVHDDCNPILSLSLSLSTVWCGRKYLNANNISTTSGRINDQVLLNGAFLFWICQQKFHKLYTAKTRKSPSWQHHKSKQASNNNEPTRRGFFQSSPKRFLINRSVSVERDSD